MLGVIIAIILFVFGLALTIKCADLFVRASVWFADVTGVSKVVVGATVIAFATSAPEFFVSIIATYKGYSEIAIGNVVGSVICNIGIAFAIIAICRPHKVTDKLFAPNGVIMIVSTAFVMVACFFGAVTLWQGVFLVALFATFTFINIKYAKHHHEDWTPEEIGLAEDLPHHPAVIPSPASDATPKHHIHIPHPHIIRKPTNTWEIILNLCYFIGGIAGLVWGADLVVNNAETIASVLGISEHIISVTIIAIGTSLPEIITTITAIVKKENGLSVGNIIGSNVFDISIIIACGVFAGGTITPAFHSAFIDLPIALAFALIAIVPSLVTRRVQRWQGYSLALLYLGYTVATCIMG